MTEQLSMFSGESITAETPKELPSQTPPDEAMLETEYDLLDYQLAALMLELNDYVPDDEDEKKFLIKTLRDCTLEISKNTREGQIAKAISEAQKNTLLKATVVGEKGEYMPLIIDTGFLYLNRYWQYQQRLAHQINTRLQNKEDLNEAQRNWIESRLADYFEKDQDASETNWQKYAAEQALQNRFLIVSGGPGTGKTTTITRILALLIEQYLVSENEADKLKSEEKWGGVSDKLNRTVFSNGFNILLAAPTGKAAIRMLDSMREASQYIQTHLDIDDAVMNSLPNEAHTLHKLLGYKHNSAQFKFNKSNTLNADVVLVDEASMVDIALMSKLVDAVPEHAKLILIGDKDQLASVETGSVFADMCEGLKESENLVSLKKNWRFSADSDIGQAAIAANQGDSQSLLSILNDPNNANIELKSPNEIRDRDLIQPWQDYFTVLNDADSSLTEIFTAFNQYRILCALRRGFNGSEIMNSRIETALQKQGWIERRRSANTVDQFSHWYNGRPIMISQNSYNRGLMNGDTGITLIKNGEIKVYFPSANGEFFSFSPVRLPAHQTSWTMTIHKSQGSEFNRIVLILPEEEIPLLTRQLVYTGITRAKQNVSIIASQKVLEAGVNSEVSKATMIAQHINT